MHTALTARPPTLTCGVFPAYHHTNHHHYTKKLVPLLTPHYLSLLSQSQTSQLLSLLITKNYYFKI